MNRFAWTRREWMVIAFSAPLLGACGGGGDLASDSGAGEDFDEVYVSVDAAEIAARERAATARRTQSSAPDAAFFRMLRDVGGWQAFELILDTKDETRIRALLSRYGMRYSTFVPAVEVAGSREMVAASSSETGSAVVKPQNINDCIRFYPPEDRNKLFSLSSQTVFIDSNGRPGYATWKGGPTIPIVPGTRTECQTSVGKWGVSGDVGGHLIPAALGGWGGRANVVPKNGNLNNGPWRTVEGVPTACGKVWSTSYNVVATYASPLDVRPIRFDAQVTVTYLGLLPLTLSAVGMPNVDPTATMVAAANAFKAGAGAYC